MIFQIDQPYYDRMAAPDRSQLYSDIILHGHYVDCTYSLRMSFYDDIKANGSTLQKNLMEKDPSMQIPTRFKEYLTTIDVNTVECEQLYVLINKPALVLLENEVNERAVYTDIIHKYAKRDKSFDTLYKKLEESMENEELDFDQAGGVGQIVPLFQSHDRCKYRGMSKWKMCMLIDRDTKNNTYFSSKNNAVFSFTCGKDNTTITDDDIYSLGQTPYIWHMWYFKEIENYFPEKQYKAIGLDTKQAPNEVQDWHYKKMGDFPGYNKNNLSMLTKGMTYDDYEDGLQHFPNAGGISEIQLFLLKLVRII